MQSFLDPTVPIVVLGNFTEGHFDFLSRTADPRVRQEILENEDVHGDRILLWVGEPKLVFSSYPIQHADFLFSQLGYSNTLHAFPSNPTGKLSLDIIQQKELINKIVEYSVPHHIVQIIPYATTPEFLLLVETLRLEYGLTVLLPESPAPDLLWIRDYIDTKFGFRILLSNCQINSNTSILPGYVCQTHLQAAQAVDWFMQRGEACILKVDTGENGIGHRIISPTHYGGKQSTLELLQHNCYLNNDLIIIERYLSTNAKISPSLELFVPAKGKGYPQITYVSQQIFKSQNNSIGDFCGVLISNEILHSKWYPSLAESGLAIANYLQSLGYVGHFDLDCILDDNEHVYLLEINARRTGGTHVHEFAQHYFGNDYINRVALLSNDSADSGKINRVDNLLHTVKNLLFPINGRPTGIIITVTSSLLKNKFGYIVVGENSREILDLEYQLAKLLGN